MKKESKHYSLEMKSIELSNKDGKNTKKFPLMSVKIFGVPGLGEIIHLMGDIKEEIKLIEGDYISVTDLTELSINKFLSKIILRGMESAYKSVLGVGRPSIISFVILNDSQDYAAVLSNSLQTINNQKIDSSKDYKYRYYFVRSMDEVGKIAEQIVME